MFKPTKFDKLIVIWVKILINKNIWILWNGENDLFGQFDKIWNIFCIWETWHWKMFARHSLIIKFSLKKYVKTRFYNKSNLNSKWFYLEEYSVERNLCFGFEWKVVHWPFNVPKSAFTSTASLEFKTWNKIWFWNLQSHSNEKRWDWNSNFENA